MSKGVDYYPPEWQRRVKSLLTPTQMFEYCSYSVFGNICPCEMHMLLSLAAEGGHEHAIEVLRLLWYPLECNQQKCWRLAGSDELDRLRPVAHLLPLWTLPPGQERNDTVEDMIPSEGPSLFRLYHSILCDKTWYLDDELYELCVKVACIESAWFFSQHAFKCARVVILEKYADEDVSFLHTTEWIPEEDDLQHKINFLRRQRWQRAYEAVIAFMLVHKRLRPFPRDVALIIARYIIRGNRRDCVWD